MTVAVLGELPGRLALSFVPTDPITAAVWERSLRRVPGVTEVRLWPRAGRLAVRYDRKAITRSLILRTVRRPRMRPVQPLPSPTARIALSTALYLIARVLRGTPALLLTIWSTAPYILRGLRSLLARRLDSSVLDATAIGLSLFARDFASAGTITYFLNVGRHLEAAAIEHQSGHFAELLDGHGDEVWLLVDGVERAGHRSELKPGDHIMLRAGYVVPADGVLAQGDVLADFSWLTGEALPRSLGEGDRIYEGARVLQGHAVLVVEKSGKDTRLSHMVRIVDAARRTKSEAETYAERLADRTVPWIFGLAALVLATTRNPVRARTALLVDYSCALKLSISLAMHIGIRTLAERDVLVKGSRWMERLARVDTLALDKTGTLTQGRPHITDIIAFPGYDREFILRNGACVEEHFAHPISRAIVQAAADAGLAHAGERHGEVTYRVGRGVFSTVDNRRFVLGGRWAFEEAGAQAALNEIAALEAKGRSLVFVLSGEDLAGLVAFDDPLRPEAADTLARLRKMGVGRHILVTGDEARVAERIGGDLDLDEIHTGVFPEQKVALVRSYQSKGHTVAMIGDGINDGPALSTADVGVAVANGADLSREAADVLLLGSGLTGLIDAVAVSRRTVFLAERKFRQVMSWNSLLLGLALTGLLSPVRSALLHNLGTVFFCYPNGGAQTRKGLEGPAQRNPFVRRNGKQAA